MGIKMLVKDKDINPTVFCDVCDQPILEVSGGMYAWRPTNYRDGTINELVFFHKGSCDDVNCLRTGVAYEEWFTRELTNLPEEIFAHCTQ
jgi:hypothetical protein